jgi:hypothetical protein
MAEINDEMRVTADYAISTAKERYGLDLDFSEESLAVLDNILEKIYWGFSGHSKEEGEGGLIYNSAIIWGSYLGEYMRLKWGGTWLLKGSERRVSITSIEFAPINFIFQRITTHPEYSVRNFIQEAKNVIYASVIHPPQKAPAVAPSPVPVSKPVIVRPPRQPFHIDRRLIYITAGILGVLILATGSMAGYVMLSGVGFPALGIPPDASHTPISSPQPTQAASASLAVIGTNTPTITELPTYTPAASQTARPSRTPRFTSTPSATPTPTVTFTPTETATEYIPPTRTRTRTPTAPPPADTNTPTPTREPTNTPTETQPPPPPTIVSCGVSPSQVAAGTQTTLTFSVQFNVPGIGMSTGTFNLAWPGSQGCSDGNTDGDTTAQCTGNSGELPPNTSVIVDIQTSIGNCQVSYSTPP